VGGTEQATLRIATAIDPTRFTSVAFCRADASPVRDMFVDAGFRTATYEPAAHSYRHATRFLKASLRLAHELRRHGVDVVHCADLLAAYHAALAGWLARIPVIAHIRNRFDDISRRDRSFLWPVDKFIFVSQDTWQHFGFRFSPSRGVVVYDGVHIQHPALTGARADVCREFNIPEDAPIVGMMARVAPQKDYFTLARAAGRILQAEPQTRFLIVGDYTSAETYREHYQGVRRVLGECQVADSFIFTGQRQDVSRLLSALDVFVLSTHREGLPLVILEAMAHAKPVVATAVDGVPEIVQDGKTGLLCAHEDDVQLGEHVLSLLRDRGRATRLAEAGRKLVQTRFSTEEFGERMNVQYADSLASRRRWR
jgi:glycosyltransferase involved in cell wall biosynthesis